MKAKIITSIFFLLFSVSLFAQSYYAEYNLSIKTGVTGKMKLYSLNKNYRSDVSITIPGMPGGPMNSSTLMLASAPEKVYVKNNADKTYSEVKNTSSEMNDAPEADYQVTIIGNERSGNYGATHIKVKQLSNNAVQELWMSTDVAGYADYAKLKSPYSGKENMMKAIEAKGVHGFPVKIIAIGAQEVTILELVTTSSKSIPADMFSLNGTTTPAGSTTTKSAPATPKK